MSALLMGFSLFLFATAWAQSPSGLGTLRARFSEWNLVLLERLDREAEVDLWFQRSLLLSMGGFAAGILVHGAGPAVLLATVGMAGPHFYLRLLHHRRVEAVERQLPATLDALASALRAGQSLPQAVQWVAGEAAVPTGAEYARLSGELALGGDVDEAFRGMARRVPGAGLRTFTMVLGPLRRMGANLVPALENLAELLRRRAQMNEKLKALTAQGRMQLMVMAALLPVLLLILYAMAPHFIRPLFVTAGGRFVLGCAALLQVTGVLLARRVLNPERMWRTGS